MANKRPTPEEIVSKSRQVEVLMGQGMSGLNAITQIGVVEQANYRWRKQYGGMGVDQLSGVSNLGLSAFVGFGRRWGKGQLGKLLQ